MRYPFLIGRRVILSRENRLLVNLTTWIAVVGVAMGVAALVVVNGIYDGYIAEIRGTFVDVLAHLEISGPPAGGLRGDEEFLEWLEDQPGVEAAAPVIRREALMVPRRGWNTLRAGVGLLGMDAERSSRVTRLHASAVSGESDPGANEIVLGHALAERLGVELGDAVIVFADFEAAPGRRPNARRRALTVAGTFRSGFYQFDRAIAYASLDTVRELFGESPGAVDDVLLRLEDPWRADEVRAALQPDLAGLRISTWREQNRGFFAQVEMTRVIVLVILVMLVVVASSNVIGSLVMMVHDRTRDIGILRAMGVTRGGVTMVFLLCGGVIGVLGVTVGIGAGMGVCALVVTSDLITIPESVYFIDHLPVVIDWAKVGLVAAITLVISLGASVLPALRAARLDPVEALRYE